MTDAQIHPFNEGGVQPSREAHPLQGTRESSLCPKAHYRRDLNQLASPVAFLHLAIDQASRHLPPTCYSPLMTHLKPLAKMGREGIEVQI